MLPALPAACPADQQSVALPTELKTKKPAFACRPSNSGSPTWTRTRDLRINSPSLYQLSYQGKEAILYMVMIALSSLRKILLIRSLQKKPAFACRLLYSGSPTWTRTACCRHCRPHALRINSPSLWQLNCDENYDEKKPAFSCRFLNSGSPTWTRTRDLRINSPSLYQLSYQGKVLLFESVLQLIRRSNILKDFGDGVNDDIDIARI